MNYEIKIYSVTFFNVTTVNLDYAVFLLPIKFYFPVLE